MAFKIGHIVWNKNKKLTKKHKENIGKSMKGKTSHMEDKTKDNGLYPENCGFSKGHPQYISEYNFKKGHIGWNAGTSIWLEFNCLICGKKFKTRKCHTHNEIAKYCSNECCNKSKKGQIRLDMRQRLIKICQKCGKSFEIRPCENYRKFCSRKCARKPLKPHWGEYRGIKMRSGWEIAYAKWLDIQNIKWKYESKTFDLGYTTYTPDFYLPEKEIYVEIKGWMQPRALIKIKEFIKQNPDIKYLLLAEKELKEMEIIKC